MKEATVVSADDPGRAEALHASSIVVIGHDHHGDEAHLLAMKPAGLTAKITLVSVDADLWSGAARKQASLHEYTGYTNPALIQLQRVREVIESNPERLCLALTGAHLRRAHEQGVSAVLLGLEGGKPIEQDLELLHILYRLGLRIVQLTWAGGNDICDRRDPPVCEGLTAFGRRVVHEMNALGMLIDPGHCSDKTFFDVLELSSRPVAVLHSAPAGAKPDMDPRSTEHLSDRKIRALAEGGGVLGLHFFSHFLNPTAKATVEDIVDHVDYIADLVGIEHVALGADYFPLTDAFLEGHDPPRGGFMGIPEAFDSYDKLIHVTQALCARGYPDEDIRLVLGGNLMRVFECVFDR